MKGPLGNDLAPPSHELQLLAAEARRTLMTRYYQLVAEALTAPPAPSTPSPAFSDTEVAG